MSLEMLEKIVNFEKRLQMNMSKIFNPTHLSLGHEHIAAELSDVIRDIDWVFSTHRNHHHYLAKGGSEEVLWDEIMGKETGLNKGFSGSQAITDKSLNFHASAILGGLIGVATGTAYAIKLNGTSAIVVCCIGDAGTEQGVFWESLNFSSLNQLPILFLCENNGMSVDARIEERQSTEIEPRIRPFGIDTFKNLTEAVNNVRELRRPSFCEQKVVLRAAHLNMATMMDLCDQKEPIHDDK